MTPKAARHGFRALLVFVTLVSAWLSATRLRVSPDLAALFPDEGESHALARFTRAFGGGDIALVLLRGPDEGSVRAASTALGATLRDKPTVVEVVDHAPEKREFSPTLAWAYADEHGRERLRTLTGEGMRARLEETRALLLAPGSSEASEWIARDPLRLSAVPWETNRELAASVRGNGGDAFSADEGRARLLVLEAKGRALDSGASKAFVDDVEAAFTATCPRFPGVTCELTGGHAIARQTEAMLKRDLATSGVLSMVLASIAFVVTFRRARALVAVLPPLLLGTLWTTGVAAFLPGGLSAIAIAFASVVVGVGVDSGVHVYGALLEGRRRGLSPDAAAEFARTSTRKPVLVAALVAGAAFASLSLSQLAALRQLGILSGIGELATALAIVAITPRIGAWLESKAPPVANVPRWTNAFVAITKSKGRALTALALACAPAVALAVVGGPRVANAIVAIRPSQVAALVTQDTIYGLFGGKPGQWIVLSIDRDRGVAETESDRIAEALGRQELAGNLVGFDALTTFAPSEATIRERLRERDALDLPARGKVLERSLDELGFDHASFEGAVAEFAAPASLPPRAGDSHGAAAWLEHRHRASESGETLVAIFVRPTGDVAKDAALQAAIHAASKSAIVTGYPYLEAGLKKALFADLPKIVLVALVIAAIALRAALGSLRDVAIALATIVVELALVALAMRVFGVHFHVYDALVLPVLIGITLDESMFLLHAANEAPSGGAAEPNGALVAGLRREGPLVVATALTTAAGFGALIFCTFDGLADLGAVGFFGSIFGVIASLVVVPAAMVVFPKAPQPAETSEASSSK